MSHITVQHILQVAAVHLHFKSPAEKSCAVLNGNDISQTLSARTQAVARTRSDALMCVRVCSPWIVCMSLQFCVCLRNARLLSVHVSAGIVSLRLVRAGSLIVLLRPFVTAILDL